MKSLTLKILLLFVGGVLSLSCIRIINAELDEQHGQLSQIKSSLSGFKSEIYESLTLVMNLSEETVSAFSYTSTQNKRKKNDYNICLDYKNPLLVHRTLNDGSQSMVEMNFNNESVVKYCKDIKRKIDRDYEVEMKINFLSKKNFIHKIKAHVVEKPINFVLLLSGRGVLSSDSNSRSISISQNALVETKVIDGSLVLGNQKLKIEFSSGGEAYFSEIDVQINGSKINLNDIYFKLIQKEGNVKIGYLKFSKRSNQEIEVYDADKKLITS